MIKMFGERLKQLRKEKKVSQKTLADALFISQQAIAKWESDKSSPNPETVRRIAEYFNVSTDYLLEVDPENKNAPPQSDGAFESELTEKDELDISRRLDAMLSDLDKSDSALMFDGEPLDDESRELLIASLENSIRMAKLINKRKYTPKKYRKGTANDRGSDIPQS